MTRITQTSQKAIYPETAFERNHTSAKAHLPYGNGLHKLDKVSQQFTGVNTSESVYAAYDLQVTSVLDNSCVAIPGWVVVNTVNVVTDDSGSVQPGAPLNTINDPNLIQVPNSTSNPVFLGVTPVYRPIGINNFNIFPAGDSTFVEAAVYASVNLGIELEWSTLIDANNYLIANNLFFVGDIPVTDTVSYFLESAREHQIDAYVSGSKLVIMAPTAEALFTSDTEYLINSQLRQGTPKSTVKHAIKCVALPPSGLSSESITVRTTQNLLQINRLTEEKLPRWYFQVESTSHWDKNRSIIAFRENLKRGEFAGAYTGLNRNILGYGGIRNLGNTAPNIYPEVDLGDWVLIQGFFTVVVGITPTTLTFADAFTGGFALADNTLEPGGTLYGVPGVISFINGYINIDPEPLPSSKFAYLTEPVRCKLTGGFSLEEGSQINSSEWEQYREP